jgi:5-methyltetrahydropteroyltriglutamate--homocysteine methyltransferase
MKIDSDPCRCRLGASAFQHRRADRRRPSSHDIHSPRCPSAADMSKLIAKAKERLAPDQIWVNPDCGLKTRRWEEVKPALQNMVAAARAMWEGA